MEQTKGALRKSNPLRSDMSWQLILIQGLVAGAIGLYALLAEESARKNIIFLIGVFLLGNGLISAVDGIRRGSGNPMAPYRLLRAGFGLATGALVVINRFSEFMSIETARVVVGIGLLGIGGVTLGGLIAVRKQEPFRVIAFLVPLLLIVWGFVCLYQAANDKSSTAFLGWFLLAIGVALVALAVFRRQRAASTAIPTAV